MLDNRIQIKLLDFASAVNKLTLVDDVKEYGVKIEALVKLYTEEIQDIDKELPAELVNERFEV